VCANRLADIENTRRDISPSQAEAKNNAVTSGFGMSRRQFWHLITAIYGLTCTNAPVWCWSHADVTLWPAQMRRCRRSTANCVLARERVLCMCLGACLRALVRAYMVAQSVTGASRY